MATVLALDVGFAALGWAVIDAAIGDVCCAGVIRTVKSQAKRGVRVADDDWDRCAVQARAVAALVTLHTPACVVAELPTGGSKSARATRAMALGTGIAATVCTLLSIPVVCTTPRDGKIAATGRANADKVDVQAGVERKLHGATDALTQLKRADVEHAADAMAAYIAARHDPIVEMATRAGA